MMLFIKSKSYFYITLKKLHRMILKVNYCIWAEQMEKCLCIATKNGKKGYLRTLLNCS